MNIPHPSLIVILWRPLYCICNINAGYINGINHSKPDFCQSWILPVSGCDNSIVCFCTDQLITENILPGWVICHFRSWLPVMVNNRHDFKSPPPPAQTYAIWSWNISLIITPFNIIALFTDAHVLSRGIGSWWHVIYYTCICNYSLSFTQSNTIVGQISSDNHFKSSHHVLWATKSVIVSSERVLSAVSPHYVGNKSGLKWEQQLPV